MARIAILTSHFFIDLAEVDGSDRILWGGAERYQYELDRFLREDGHTVVHYQGYAPVPEQVYEARLKHAKKNRLPLPPKPRTDVFTKHYKDMEIVCIPNQDRGHYNSIPSLTKAFNQISLDADIHIYFATHFCHPAVLPNSISISHGVFWDFPYHPYHERSNEEERKRFWEVTLFGFTAPDICVSVDHNVPNVLRAIRPGSESKIVVIPNFVDTKRFHPVEKSWDGIRVLFPRRSTLLRGFNHFTTAAKKLPEYQFVTCGDTVNPSSQSDIEENVKKVFPNLTSTHVGPDDMPSLYQSCDIAVIPTLAAEGSSLSEIEALACGLPTIVSGVGGTCEFIIDGYNAIVWDPWHEDLADVIKMLAEDEPLRKKLSKNARETALEFDIEIWRNRWRRIIPPKVTP